MNPKNHSAFGICSKCHSSPCDSRINPGSKVHQMSIRIGSINPSVHHIACRAWFPVRDFKSRLQGSYLVIEAFAWNVFRDMVSWFGTLNLGLSRHLIFHPVFCSIFLLDSWGYISLYKGHQSFREPFLELHVCSCSELMLDVCVFRLQEAGGGSHDIMSHKASTMQPKLLHPVARSVGGSELKVHFLGVALPDSSRELVQ